MVIVLRLLYDCGTSGRTVSPPLWLRWLRNVWWEWRDDLSVSAAFGEGFLSGTVSAAFGEGRSPEYMAVVVAGRVPE